MAAPVRSFPIRLDPIDGEALDSWLDALSYRLSTAWGDLVDAIGLTPPEDPRDNSWLLALAAHQAHAITMATGLPDAQLQAMTLSHYDGTGLKILQDIGRADRAFPWGRSRFSRYCPHCLRDNGGRWQLFWRLGWAFACEKHHCLLLDECPTCRQRQREHPTPTNFVSDPGHCMRPAVNATGRTPARCAANLAAAATPVFTREHPVLAAQRTIRTIIETGTTELAVYAQRPVRAAQILTDIRAVASRILAHRSGQDLQSRLPADLYEAYRQVHSDTRIASTTPRPTTKPGLSAPAHAATAAAGVVAALHILSAESIDAAADRMRWLISDARGDGHAVSATTVTTWGVRTTVVLAGIQLASLGPMLKPSDQLRYRIGSALPTGPRRISGQIGALAAKLPAALWMPWTLRLSPPRTDHQNLATALSCAVLLADSRLSLDAATAEMNRGTDGHALSHVLQRLEADPCWNDTRAAIIRLADHLNTDGTPIDYRRRRDLDYSTLLTAQTWNRICRDTATAKGGNRKLDIVRCHLYAQLTGSPVNMAPWFAASNEFISHLNRFPAQLTPQLAAALDLEARDLLARHHIFEPVSWFPPPSIMHGLQLPGIDPETIDVDALHAHTRQTTALGEIADQLNTSVEAVRHMLICHPLPQAPLTFDQKRVRGLHAIELEKALPHNKLYELYVDRKLSFEDISAMHGVERKAVSRLAARYGIDARPPGRSRQHKVVERDWLYTQYVINGRTLPELAAETGMSTPNMARWAKVHHVPMRGRGTPSHTAHLQDRRRSENAPGILKPALAGTGGIERLSRFATASTYPTLRAAAHQMRVGQFALVSQISRLERELDGPLLVRAQYGKPMVLTELGASIIAAFTSWNTVDPEDPDSCT
ncbi:hypothetical protein HNP40_001412 [Mycobacteroides chelonae]|nr:hypothetical protein [Mycobacteroides chelonae]